MSTGIKIKLGKGSHITKDGKKVTTIPIYRDASHAMAAKKSPKQTWRGAR